MATGKTYSGRQFKVLLGLADNNAGSSLGEVGADTQDANCTTSSKVYMRVDSPLNDVAWDAGYNRAEIERAGTRGLRAEDVINHYGSGVWTWDFSYVADKKQAIHNLLHLVYPNTASAVATALTINPTTDSVIDYQHGNDDAVDRYF